MQTRNRLIAGAVFLLLAAALIIISQRVDFSRGRETATPPAGLEPLFPEAQDEAAIAIRITDNETGGVFAASSEDGETWVIEESPAETDPALVVDSARLRGVLAALPSLTPSRILSEVEALAPYGLDNVHYTISFRVTSGEEYTFYVGSPNPTHTGYYARLTEDVGLATEVYLLPSYIIDQLVDLLDNPPLVEPTATPEPSPEQTATLEPEG